MNTIDRNRVRPGPATGTAFHNGESPLPRVFVKVSRGIVSVRSDADLDVTVVDDDLDIRCANVVHRCTAEELDGLLQYYHSYRYDQLYCGLVNDTD